MNNKPVQLVIAAPRKVLLVRVLLSYYSLDDRKADQTDYFVVLLMLEQEHAVKDITQLAAESVWTWCYMHDWADIKYSDVNIVAELEIVGDCMPPVIINYPYPKGV